MKTLNKLKKKLKFKQWFYENEGKLLLGLMAVPALLNIIFAYIMPIVGLVSLGIYGIIGIAGGIDLLWFDEKHQKEIDNLKSDIDALTSVNNNTIKDLNSQISLAESKNNATSVKQQKQLIKALIRRKKLAEQALKEQIKEEQNTIQL